MPLEKSTNQFCCGSAIQFTTGNGRFALVGLPAADDRRRAHFRLWSTASPGFPVQWRNTLASGPVHRSRIFQMKSRASNLIIGSATLAVMAVALGGGLA